MKIIIGAMLIGTLLGAGDGKKKDEIVLPDQRILAPQDSVKILQRIDEIEKELEELYKLRDGVGKRIELYERRRNKAPFRVEYRPSV